MNIRDLIVPILALAAALSPVRAQDPIRAPHDRPVEAAWWIELAGPTIEDSTARSPGLLVRADGARFDLSRNAFPQQAEGLSPDRRRRLVIVRDRGRQRDLVIRPIRAGVLVTAAEQARARGEVRLTRDHDDLDPFWSDDGGSVLFRSDRGGDGWQLWRVDADGEGEPERLTEGEAKVHEATLSPDGGRVLLIRSTQRPPERRQGMLTRDLDVSILDLASGAIRTLIGDAFTADAAWSPDGSRIACGVATDLIVLDAASGETLLKTASKDVQEGLYSHGANYFHWRPDGEAFTCKFSFLGQTMMVNGRAPRLFGDDQVFVIGLDGSTTMLAAPRHDDELRRAWTTRVLAWRRLPR